MKDTFYTRRRFGQVIGCSTLLQCLSLWHRMAALARPAVLNASTPNISRSLYGGGIATAQPISATLKPAVEDLQGTLRQMTGSDFVFTQDLSGANIHLIRQKSPAAPADAVDALKGKGFEPFIIRGDATQLQIIANHDLGLSHGIYFYLEQLGCRWLLPGDNWTIIPKRSDITLAINCLVEPSYRARSYFGTGGFGPSAPYDTKFAFRDRTLTWQRRLRFGGEYRLGGHSGEAFNAEHKDILLRHPEYLAKIDGKHTPWSNIAKLNVGDPAAVALYVNWTLERFRQLRKSHPDSPERVTVSVDPADGYGFGNNISELPGNGSPSDQAFYLANQCAKAIRAEFSDAYVNCYAYGAHADVPSFPLEPNVIVSVIPYAFQTTGRTPEEFIAAWKAIVPGRMNIYDYWSITDWTHDEPSFNYLETPARKLRFWHENDIEGFNGESTYGAGPMGIGWYVASYLLWNLQLDERTLIEEFYDRAFGQAKVPMKRMLERWARSFKPISAELGLSYRDLHEAMHSGDTAPAVVARLDDYARYLHYLRLRVELANTNDATLLAQKESAFVKYLFDIYDSNMVHSFRLRQLAVRGRNSLAQEYDIANPDAPGWKRVAPLVHSEVAAMVADGLQKYPAPDFPIVAYTGNLIPLQPLTWTPVTDDPWGAIMPTTGRLEGELEIPRGLTTLPVRVSRAIDMSITVSDATAQHVFTHDVVGTGGWEGINKWDEVALPVLAPGRYKIQFRAMKNQGYRFQTLRGVPVILRMFLSPKWGPSPRLYFYVPRGLQNIALYYPQGDFGGALKPQILNPQGTPMRAERRDEGKVIVVTVPAGQDGRPWSLNQSVSPDFPHQMLNVPQAFAFSSETVMVPSDAL